MSKLKKIVGHIVNGSLLNRIRYQFSGIKKWEDFKKSNQGSILHSVGRGVKLKLYKDSYLSYLIIRGDFEVHEINFIKKYLKKEDIFVDIGANIGIFSCIAAKKSHKVYSIEPTTHTFQRLIENFNLNNIQNAEALHLAVSAEIAELEMHISEDGMDAWNTLGAKPDVGNFILQKVNTITLDKFVLSYLNNNTENCLIKIDVEGWEKLVIEGGHITLSNETAPDIIIEITDENLNRNGTNGLEILTSLQNYGYHLFEIKEILIPHRILNKYEYSNIFCTKNLNRVSNRKLK